MLTDNPAIPPAPPSLGERLSALPCWVPAALGFLIMAIPSLVSMAQQTWATEAGTHAPIVLATGAWLMVYNGLSFSRARSDAGSGALTAIALVGAWLVYIFGRAYGFIFLEGIAVYAVFVALLFRYFGWVEIKRQAFPLFYLLFVIPLPGWMIRPITAPLQMLVSWAAALVVQAAGYPVERQGVSLFVGPYQLLVEDACSGLNSLIGLLSLSLFYIYVIHRQSWRYALTLVLFVVPIAIVVNIIRVIAIMLICYHFGDAVAQGILHRTTGMVLFILALVLVFLVDKLLSMLFARRLAHV